MILYIEAADQWLVKNNIPSSDVSGVNLPPLLQQWKRESHSHKYHSWLNQPL